MEKEQADGMDGVVLKEKEKKMPNPALAISLSHLFRNMSSADALTPMTHDSIGGARPGLT